MDDGKRDDDRGGALLELALVVAIVALVLVAIMGLVTKTIIPH